MKEVTLSKIIGETGVFIDGDWVESKDQDVNGDVRLIQLADIGDGVFINKSNRFLTSEKAKELKCTYLKQGDLLIARMPDPLGRACIFPGLNMPCVTVVDVCIVRPDSNIANPHWLKFLINSYDFRNKINKYITGTTRQRISRGNLEKLSFNLPEIQDQLKIASILDKAESSIKQRQDSIILIDDFLKSTFLKMFSKFFSKSYSKKLETLCTKITDGTHDTPIRLKQGIKFITGKHIRPSFIDFENSDYVTEEVHKEIYRRCNPEFGDILYTNIGVNLGTAAMNNVSFEFSMKNVALLKLNQSLITSRYLEHLLNLPSRRNRILEMNSSGGAQQFLSLGQIKNIDIPVPPIELQKTFSEIVEKSEILKTQFKNSLIELENLYGSLSQKAFKGELDLSKLILKHDVEYESTDNDRTEPKRIDTEEISVEAKKEEPEDKRYGDPFEVDEATAKKQGKLFYKQWQELHPVKPHKFYGGGEAEIKWEWLANQIKDRYENKHFNFEMLMNFIKKEKLADTVKYYSSEEMKVNPKLNDAEDVKAFLHTAITNVLMDEEQARKTNLFLKLKQVFYNAEKENFQLILHKEDFKLLKDRTAQERSGIYFTVEQ